MIVRHIVENVNNERRTMERENKLEDILARTVVANESRSLGEGFGTRTLDGLVPVLQAKMRRARVFPPSTPSNIYITARPYC